jgi:hypothetical protein
MHFTGVLQYLTHMKTGPGCSHNKKILAIKNRFVSHPDQLRPPFDMRYKPGQVSEKDDAEPSPFSWMKIRWQIRY